MPDWTEDPECPYCGAIKSLYGYESTTERVTCPSCARKFQLDVQVTRRYRATAMEEE